MDYKQEMVKRLKDDCKMLIDKKIPKALENVNDEKGQGINTYRNLTKALAENIKLIEEYDCCDNKKNPFDPPKPSFKEDFVKLMEDIINVEPASEAYNIKYNDDNTFIIHMDVYTNSLNDEGKARKSTMTGKLVDWTIDFSK